ncbi:MAG: hypothetical protein EOS27_16580 [Mesorhizobium sp.]|nr:MAG: hypothetical protein EOS27_16580 [Mesorhizobium sp.]
MQNGDGTSGKKWHKSDTSGSPSVRAAPATTQKKTAAQAGPLNGGNGIEKHSSAFKENDYHSDGSAATCAARWYAENRGNCPHPVVPTLRAMFSLSALEAVQAIREANGGGR